MKNSLQRLKDYIDFKKINVSSFEKSIGMSNASFGKSLKDGKGIGSDKIEKILKNYTDLNPVWLLTGEGEMILSDKEKALYELRIQDAEILNAYKEQVEMAKQIIEIQKQRISELEKQLKK